MSINTNPKHYEAFKWCTENRIKVYPKIKGDKFILVYTIDGVAHSSGKLYDKSEYMQNIWEFYLFLYNKLKDVSN
tara:strand:- start:169 stop:393 length:225 start_codon:yes stop_codon:yes gene_type:complete